MIQSQYDVIIIGSGHNGLVAAAYLAQAQLRVLIVEKNDYVGGATTSQKLFPDYDAHLSRYAYLVSLFPDKIKKELGLTLNLKRRQTASFTPFERNKKNCGLLISNENESLNKAQINELNVKDYAGLTELYEQQKQFAEKIWDSFLEPLKTKDDWKKVFEDDTELWKLMVEKPIGHLIEKYIEDDILRGIVLTDAKIGVFANAHHTSLLQNRTYLYHVIGNKTGEWQVPVGGMGAVIETLKAKVTELGVTILTEAEVTKLNLGEPNHSVCFVKDNQKFTVKARFVLANAAPKIVSGLLGETLEATAEDEGCVFKVNMLLSKLPKLKAEGVRPEDAFAGTFHINQGYEQMAVSYQEALDGKIPTLPPCEIYCHTLTDSSILSPTLAAAGYHTLTLFGLDVPYRLFIDDNEATKKQLLSLYLEGLNSYLSEPIEDCIARATDGSLCIEAKSPVDLENEIGLPTGNIFHNALSWFYADNDQEAGTWGVETSHERLYICGSGAKRGGAVSGICGHNAAMKVLRTL